MSQHEDTPESVARLWFVVTVVAAAAYIAAVVVFIFL